MLNSEGKNFVLVHGLCHGAWCWYKVTALLKEAGHTVTPVDLGGSGINPKQIGDLAHYSDYCEPLMELMASLPEDEKVILVGHSFGGLAISFAMEKFPTKVLAGVYVTAFMPNLDSPPAICIEELFKDVMEESLMDSQVTYDEGPNGPPNTVMFGPNHMVAMAYQVSPKEDLELAKACLRPGKWFVKDLAKEGQLTKANFGSVNRVYVMCGDDLLIKEGLQKWYIEHNPTEDVKTIAKADHMPMFSKPKELYQCLQDVADKY